MAGAYEEEKVCNECERALMESSNFQVNLWAKAVPPVSLLI